MVPGTHQPVAGSLAGRVRAVGLDAVRLRKRWVILPQGPVDLVGGDMQETEGRLLGFG